MYVANTHLKPVIGIDIHFVNMPFPFIPLPHPYIGLVIDPFDYLPFIGATVKVNNVPRGNCDTAGMIITFVHIPFGAGFTLIPMIGHDSQNFFGSKTVSIDGAPMSGAGFVLMTCNDIGLPLSFSPGKKLKPIPSLYLPTSFCIPLQWGKPVMVGGPLVPNFSLMALLKAFAFGSLLKGFGKAGGKMLKALNHKVLKQFPSTQKLSSRLCKVGFEPVDLITGRVNYEYTDFELPGPIPISWTRNWDSDSSIEGPLGHGVQLCYDRTVQIWPELECLSVMLADGRLAVFPLLHPGEEFYHPQENILLRRKQNGHFLLEDYNGSLYYHFNLETKAGTWRLSFIENYSGNRIQLHYTGGNLSAITDSAGRQLLIQLDKKHRITQVIVKHRGLEQILVTYGYNEAGDLVSIADALNQATTIEYRYHLMIKKTDRNGQSFYWEYDSKKRCIHTWGDGGVLAGFIKYGKGHNTVTNSLDENTTYYFDENNLCIQETDHYGNHRYTEYTEDFNIYREIDEAGNITGYVYDNRSRLKEKIFPDGTSIRYHHNEHNQITLITNPDGSTQVFGYDPSRRLQFINYPNGRNTAYEYNAEGQLASVIETGNRKTMMTYDEDENLAGLQLPDGATAHWKYDALGRCIQSTNTTGEVRYFEYDPLNRISNMYLPDGNTIRLEYNAYTQVTQAADRHNSVQFEYTALGSLKKRKLHNREMQFLYDTEERLNSVVNEAGRHYSFGYNKRGEIINETGFDGLQRQYERDATGKTTKVIRAGGRYTKYEYDTNGQITRVEYHDGSWELYNYDRNGNLQEAINEFGHVRFTRNKLGYIETEEQDGYLVRSTYDKAGERINITSSLGAAIQLQRNKLGLVTNMQAKVNNLLWEAQMKYNQAGQEIERLLPGGLTSEWRYDQAARPGEHKVSRRGVVQSWKKYTWDANDRLTNVFDALSQGNNHFRYETFSSLVFAQYADNSIIHRATDATGNIYESTTKTDRKYNNAGALQESQQYTYKYDEEGNLISRTDKSNRKSTSYEWYANGMLKKVVRPDGKEITFTYDALGRRISKCFAGKITRWVWDNDVPLHEWTYDEKEKPSVVVNEWGEMTFDKQEPNPHNALHAVSGITWVFEAGKYIPAAKIENGETYSIICDHLGTPQWMYDSEGKIVWEGFLDIYGRIRTLHGKNSSLPFRFPGQYEDVETGLYYNRFRYYDPQMGTYISQDPIGLLGGSMLYAYVPDVNSEVDILGLAGTGRGWLNWAKKWHDKRADEIFGEGNKGRNIRGRQYDKYYDKKDIEYKSDNFSKGPRTKESLERMNRQLDKDIANKAAGRANPHWHFEHDPSVADDMKDFLKKMDDNGIPRTHGKTYPDCN
ncbi:RHS repeat-associated core domain-containing protein [Longitalea luteola]|uniref:RHS repeat-associated core domain-containing protein n=1 Tax=Longitalea luteola TaxID=2812563 RepID=UPI001A97ACEC|nr:RHS repeat-associated core domain-containing protein [Longitalea luteola]